MSYQKHLAEDVRLIILKQLADENDLRLNESILDKVLESFGHRKSRDYLRTQLKQLEELGAVRLTEAGSVLVAELLRPGQDHVDRRMFLEGVAQPSAEG